MSPLCNLCRGPASTRCRVGSPNRGSGRFLRWRFPYSEQTIQARGQEIHERASEDTYTPCACITGKYEGVNTSFVPINARGQYIYIKGFGICLHGFTVHADRLW